MKRKRKRSTEAKDARSGSSEAASHSAPPFSPGRRLVFGLVASVILPLALLGIVEIVLRLAGYGYPTGFFKSIRIGGEDYLVENDKFGLRFFPPEVARSPAPVVMKAKKPPGTYRIFVFGESAALGDPKPAYGAGRYLKVLLSERFPQKKFEVICVAVTAINSHAIVPIARDCARQDGDLWIIYMGNNEMIGPFGASTVFGAQSPPLGYVRFSLALERLRVGQLLMALGRWITSNRHHPSSWAGMKMFMENRLAPEDPRKLAVYRNFRSNLEDILRAGREVGVPMLLNTVAVNLKDCAPFASLSVTNLSSNDLNAYHQFLLEAGQSETNGNFGSAAQAYEGAANLDALSATLQFQLGSSQFHLSNYVAAAQHFQRACDFDALAFRADSRINGVISQVARASTKGTVAFFDAANYFATNSAGDVPGQKWFYEHVHFNFDGNYRLGRVWAEQTEQMLRLGSNAASSGWASQERCERMLALTDWNRAAVFGEVLRRFKEAPFTNQLTHLENVAWMTEQLRQVNQRMNKTNMPQAREVYVEALKQAPDDHRLHENFAEYLSDVGQLAEAATEWRRVRELIPHHHAAWFQEGELLRRQGKLAEAEPLLLESVRLRPDFAEGWLELGNTHVLQGQTEQALQDYAREQRLAPGDSRVYYHIGKALLKLEHRPEALKNLREAIRLNPSFWEAHYALGEELGFEGNVDEARQELAETIKLKPGYAPAHFNLGVALVKSGQLPEAMLEFQETLRLDPQNKLAQQYYDQLHSKAGPSK